MKNSGYFARFQIGLGHFLSVCYDRWIFEQGELYNAALLQARYIQPC